MEKEISSIEKYSKLYYQYKNNNSMMVQIIDDLIRFFSEHLIVNKEEKAFYILEDICKNEEVPLSKRLYVYRHLIIFKFKNKISWTVNEKIYHQLLSELEEVVGIHNYSYLEESIRNKNRIVVITEQFLGIKHSPTKLLLSMVKDINDYCQDIEEVYIINSRAIVPEVEAIMYNNIALNTANYTSDTFNKLLKDVGIDRCGVAYEQSDDLFFFERLRYMLQLIHEINPIRVIGFGGTNYLTDMVRHFIETYTIGLTRELPVSLSQYLVNYYAVECIEEVKINESQKVIKLPYAFKDQKNMDTNEKNTKESLNLPSDKRLAVVVGNRLMDELDEPFFNLCNMILQVHHDVDIVLIGEYNLISLNQYVQKHLIDRYHLIGFRNNLTDAIGLCDLFINPKRQGGGYGGICAVKSNVPIVTIDYGDIAAYLPDIFKTSNYHELREKIEKIFSDKVYYDDLRAAINKINRSYTKQVWKDFWEYILNR